MSMNMSKQNMIFHIQGIDCATCAQALEGGVAQMDGVESCSLHFSTAKMRVVGTASRDNVIARIRMLGYDIVEPETGHSGQTEQHNRLWAILTGSPFLLIGAALLLVAMLLHGAVYMAWLAVPDTLLSAIELLALLVAGYPIVSGAVRALLVSRRVTINLLMTLAAVGAVVIGETMEAATLIVLFVLGETLEGYTMNRARDAMRSLVRLAPAEATLLVHCVDCEEHLGQGGYTGGPCPFCPLHEQRVPVAQVQVGQVIIVKPGERLPLDGDIRQGRSALNQQYITGESMPVERSVGDGVYAGSINGDGTLEVVVSAPASDTLLSRIATLVEDAQERRAPVERQVDRFAAVYTPAVVVVALLVAVVPPLLVGQPFWNTPSGEYGWFYRALALLVISCPCALAISTPVSVVSALTTATRNGILVKGGAALEALSRVTVFAFDKTGTLTSGQPRVTTVRCANEWENGQDAGGCAQCDDVLALAAAVESRSSHPLAAAVVEAAAGRHLHRRYSPAEDVVNLPGRGVQGRVNGQQVILGSHALFDAEYAHATELCNDIALFEEQGQTVVLVGTVESREVPGFIAIADVPRSESREAMAELRAAGIHHTVMLTGDHVAAANAIARQVGIDEVRAGLLPADKLDAIRAMQERSGGVAMVGDGINDTPALATATVGIAMGAAGSEQALHTSDIALMGDDLRKLPFLVRLSHRTTATIRQNIGLTLLFKAAVLALALVGWAPLWLAVAADMGTSLLVTLNGMRLLERA